MKDENSDEQGAERGLSSAAEDAEVARYCPDDNPAYRLAYADEDFLLRDDMRAVRLQLEWLKPELTQAENNIESTIVIFGAARFPEPDIARARYEAAKAVQAADPASRLHQRKLKVAKSRLSNSRYYEEARQLSRAITLQSLALGGGRLVVVTGGGPGIMEAANRGASEAGGKTIGLNIVLPFEQEPNAYITPELCFQFHYFALRKMHFLKRARALVAFPGGFGTLDELFETLTLVQTKKILRVPIVLVGREYWQRVIDFDFMVEQGAISEQDLELFVIVDSAEQALAQLSGCWNGVSR
ncbi:MAG: TIGR00730 family Rossman fold protein [Gammaproteobacteria bacterium]|nr:TIGR00730 family Rossman fold protein [Gammaproteobacteria bacterium]MBT8151990.1 TIGR00730 family Rossman fold protein [Gammaproteobacteria bacterium]NND40089.1 TIGR00730 family Rossman fold protein [Pseudomonadales bacterium]NNM11519.1 TIGR00730 family Rossman fold protein [Pseudomonadales bacterium]RZV59567.1 MAG: TIGR00730 family Rossman fold protein [Pseudomonadales bacterium]